MKGHWLCGPLARTGTHPAPSRAGDRSESGFTLIELIIVCGILPLIIGAISVALVSVLTLQSSVSNRLSDSTDAQTVATNFEKDVQSASKITTRSVGPLCGSGLQLLGLEWSINQDPANPTYQTVVSYVQVTNGSSSSLLRQYCPSGSSLTPWSTSVIAADIPVGQPPPVITPAASAQYGVVAGAADGPIPAADVAEVTFSITAPQSKYSYSLVAVPAVSLSTAQTHNVALPTTTCNFATPQTGTYASTLCFADFSSYAAPATGCDTMTAALANFTLSFCVLVSGGAVAASALNSYAPSFLGNTTYNFYRGVAGRPSLYQTANGSLTTVTITNIQVYGANGAPASGWEFVSGDAESTDSGEYITWTSDQILTLLPNSSTSPIGNACGNYNPGPSPAFPNAYLTGVGTTSVECMANGNETPGNKTGTVMLEAAAPTSLTVVMKGAGLQAIFLGLLLPG